MPAPPSVFEERRVEGAGVGLWLGSARVEGLIRAEVLLTHGLGEHASRYEQVAVRLASEGMRLHAYDLRGHGRSEGRRGDVRRYDLLLDDLELVRQAVAVPGRPLFLMGHSFGGQVTLSYALSRKVECQGLVIASPLLRLAFLPEWWRLGLGKLAMWIWPGWLQQRPIEIRHLSRDEEYLRSLAGPEMLHDRISARLFFSMRQRGEWVLEHAGDLKAPILLVHGGADRVTSLEATQEFFAGAGSEDKRLLVVPGARHEVHNDLGREEVAREVVGWMAERAGGKGGS